MLPMALSVPQQLFSGAWQSRMRAFSLLFFQTLVLIHNYCFCHGADLGLTIEEQMTLLESLTLFDSLPLCVQQRRLLTPFICECMDLEN